MTVAQEELICEYTLKICEVDVRSQHSSVPVPGAPQSALFRRLIADDGEVVTNEVLLPASDS